MKQLISKIFILSFTLQFAYGVVGFGVYGNTDSFSTQFDSFNVDPCNIDSTFPRQRGWDWTIFLC